MLINEDIVREALKTVIDPEIGFSVIDMGLIYSVEIENGGKKVIVKMTLTSPMCPYGSILVSQVDKTIRSLPGVAETDIKLVWDPQWNPAKMVSEEVKDKLGLW